MNEDVPIRAASTIILVRDADTDPAILMGRRGKGAVFMPKKYVFPGGAVDAADACVTLDRPLDDQSRRLLTLHPGDLPVTPEALAVAALRELHEETGLVLGAPGMDASALRFFLRAITPPGRPRRFDARFFIASADDLYGGRSAEFADSDELSDLHWARLADLSGLDIAPVTRVVLDHLAAHLPSLDIPARVAFIRNDRIEDRVVWLS